MNVKKTKVLVISRDQNIRVNLKLNGQVIEQVKCFKYLGSIITDDGKCQREVSTRIAEAKQAFNRMKTVLTNLKVTMRTRLRVLRSYIEPLLLYGCETWTLMTAERNRLMATEMWFLRRMLKVKWIDKVTNEEVLHRAGTKRWRIKTIAKRQVSFFGHQKLDHDFLSFRCFQACKGKKSHGCRRLWTWHLEEEEKVPRNNFQEFSQ